MKKCCIRKWVEVLSVGFLVVFFAGSACAARAWINPASGLWSDTNSWSPAALPDSLSTVYITNGLTKTVTIDATVSSTNLTIAGLHLNAPAGSTNTLLLSNGDTNNPLIVFSILKIDLGSAVHVTNSALIGTNLIMSSLVIDGAVTLDGGLIAIDTNLPIKVTDVPGAAGSITINSGVVSVGEVRVGADVSNAMGSVSLAGGELDVGSLFSIGRNPGTIGTVTMLGGQLNVPNDDLRVGDSGSGSLTVSNATLLLTNVDVGHVAQSVGTFTLQSGAKVLLSGGLSIARLGGSTGTVAMSGGQLLAYGQNIYAGRGGSGQLGISSGTVSADRLLVGADITNTASGTFNLTGGALNLSSALITGGYLLSTGQVTVAGGQISVTNPLATGYVSVPNGTFTFNGGNIIADNFLLTNSTGNFVFNGGTLNARGATVSNGSAFVVGNGVTPATLYLNGGVFSFANGLTISPNATLAGCGTVIGTVINHGTIATNCSITLVKPQITAQSKNGGTNMISFTTVSGQTYTLEFKNSLTNATWTEIPPATSGTGGIISLPDTNASVPTRFYHVRTQ